MVDYIPTYWRWRWYGFDICDIHGDVRYKLTHWNAMRVASYNHIAWFKLWFSRISSCM